QDLEIGAQRGAEFRGAGRRVIDGAAGTKVYIRRSSAGSAEWRQSHVEAREVIRDEGDRLEDDDANIDRCIRRADMNRLGMAAEAPLLFDDDHRLAEIPETNRRIGAGRAAAENADVARNSLQSVRRRFLTIKF